MAKKGRVQVTELWRGQSSQAPWSRVNGQVDSALNVRFDIREGAVVRNPTELVGTLITSEVQNADGDIVYAGGETLDPAWEVFFESIQDAIVAFIQTDTGDKLISAWDNDANPITIVDYVGAEEGRFTSPDFSYLPNDIENDIRTTSSVDTMIVVNRALSGGYSRAWSFTQAYNYIVNGNPNPAMADSLAPQTEIVAYPNLSTALETPYATTEGRVSLIENTENLDPAGYYVYHVGASYPLRASAAPDSLVINVADEIFEEFDNFYRIPDGRGPSGLGDETGDDDNGQAGAQVIRRTWPHRLVYDRDASIMYWSRSPWRQRVSGNNGSNPRSSLRGIPKRDVEFFQNRLFFLGDGSLVGSRKNDFFNLFDYDVELIADTDRIDLLIGFSNAGRALELATCGERLMILAEAGQIEFGAGEQVLTNANGRMRLLSRFKTRAMLVSSGTNVVVFMDESDNVYQLTFQDSTVGVVFTGILNIHDRQRFFGRSFVRMFRVIDTLYITDTTGRAAIHDIFIVEDTEIQSAWGDFETIGKIDFADEWEDRHRWITENTGSFTLVRYSHQEVAPPEDATFWPRIDQLERAAGTYDSGADQTTFSHTAIDGIIDTGDEIESRVVLIGEGRQHEELNPVDVGTGGEIIVSGDQSTPTGEGDPYIGFTFRSELVLTKLYPGRSAIVPVTQKLYIFHKDTTDYDVEITKENGEVETSRWQADIAGVIELGLPKPETHFSEHAVIGDPRKLVVKVIHTGSGQAIWSGMEYVLDPRGEDE